LAFYGNEVDFVTDDNFSNFDLVNPNNNTASITDSNR